MSEASAAPLPAIAGVHSDMLARTLAMLQKSSVRAHSRPGPAREDAEEFRELAVDIIRQVARPVPW
jgi:hypothetical protein